MVWEHLVISNVDIRLYLEGGPSGLGPKGCLLLWGRAERLLPRQGHMLSYGCEHASVRLASGEVWAALGMIFIT